MDQREKEEAQRRFDIEQDKLERKEAREEARIQTVERRKDENDREMRRLASEERMQANALLIAKPDGRSVVCKLIGMTC